MRIPSAGGREKNEFNNMPFKLTLNNYVILDLQDKQSTPQNQGLGYNLINTCPTRVMKNMAKG